MYQIPLQAVCDILQGVLQRSVVVIGIHSRNAEKARLETEYRELQQELTPLYAETKKLWAIHYNIYEVQHEQERQNAVPRQKKQETEH